MQNETNNSKRTDRRERCLEFSVLAIRFVETLPHSPINQVLGKQFLRAATSMGANVSEAFGAGSKRDFANFFAMGLKSAKETRYWLLLFRRTGRGDQDLLELLFNECEEISRMIAASILTVRGQR